MKTYVLAYDAYTLVWRRGVQQERRLKLKEFKCHNIEEAKAEASKFLRTRPKTLRAQFISLCTKHHWKPDT